MPRRRKTDHQPSTGGKKMTCFPDRVLESDAYLSLTVHERAVLTEIARRFNGWNNGSIVVSQRQMMAGLNTSSPRTVSQAVARLMQHGLISVEFEGEWKPRKAREFRLTWVSTTAGGRHKQATNDYLQFVSSRKTSDARGAPEAPLTDEARTSDGRKTGVTRLPANSSDARISGENMKKDLTEPDVRRAPLIDNHTPAQTNGHILCSPPKGRARERDYIHV